MLASNDREGERINPLQDRWLTAAETARYLGVKVETLSKWRLRGVGPKYSASLRRDPRYRFSGLEEYMTSGMASSTTEARTVRRESADALYVQPVATRASRVRYG